MIITHIDSKQGDIKEFNQYLKQGKPIFVLFYMEGCGPCNATRPEWAKLKNVLKNKYKNNDFVVADIDQELLSQIPDLPVQPAGFPSMVYIKGKEFENYEDSSIELKDRSVDSFVQWIDSQDALQKGGKKKRTIRTKTRKYKKKGGKWTLKYKRSINCKRPKGFSQRQYCKYGRK